MGIALREKMKGLSPERRSRIEGRAAELISEEMTLRELRHARNDVQMIQGAQVGERPVYYHVFPYAEGAVVQYWFWFNANDVPAEFEEGFRVFHEGDWEHVAIYLYHDGTNCQRLAIGSAGQQLIVVSGAPAWGVPRLPAGWQVNAKNA